MLARNITATVLYDNNDISGDLRKNLLNIDYTDNLSGYADTVDITLEDREGIWQSAWFPDRGATLTVELESENWHGLEEGSKKLRLGLFEIDQLTTEGYPSEIKIGAVSVPNNNELRAVCRTRSWEKAELKSIAGDVAADAGMELFYDVEHNPVIERAEQTEQSALSFLLQLTSDNGLALKVHENKIVIFDESDYEQQPPKLAIVKPGATFVPTADLLYITDILSYSLEAKVRDVYKSCHVKCQDVKTKAVIEATFTDPQKEDGKTLEIREQVETIAEAEYLAKKRLREKNCEEWTGSISVLGNFNLVAATTVLLVGFGAFDGKYIITQATHSIGRGYQTRTDLRRCLHGY